VRLAPDTIFSIVTAGQTAIPFVLAVVLFSQRRPRNRLLRGLMGVLVAWITTVVYTIYVYNPAGIAAGHYKGVHFPENLYDNNTIAVALIGGWIAPTIILSIMGAFQAMRDNVGLRPTERTPNPSLERTRER
jgi:hypothetical protein